ncbi:transposase, partial [Kitasatospora sp. MBT63]|uniref:transposase n=1 Tax=Kitasatospora sp. MBT63 TaxID=1444768 RepID=UPI001E583BE9
MAGAEPVTGAQHPAVQRLQFFLSESTWKFEQVNARRLELLVADPAPTPHDRGVLVIDDSGDRKDSTVTAHVGRQWLGRLGKTDNGVVTVTTLWADEHLCHPLHSVPHTPGAPLPEEAQRPAFRHRRQQRSVRGLFTSAGQRGPGVRRSSAHGHRSAPPPRSPGPADSIRQHRGCPLLRLTDLSQDQPGALRTDCQGWQFTASSPTRSKLLRLVPETLGDPLLEADRRLGPVGDGGDEMVQVDAGAHDHLGLADQADHAV